MNVLIPIATALMLETYPMTIGGEAVRNERTLLARVEDGELMRDHKKRGFRTIGYHFYIRKDGTITQHRKLLEVGAHCRPYNRCSIGICYEGGLDEHGKPCDTRTEKQTERIIELLYKLHKLFPKAKIVGHHDLPGTTPKDCPCLDAHDVFGWIEEL